MIDSLAPYPEYSAAPAWLGGSAPIHWQPRRLKTLASNLIATTRSVRDASTYIGLENIESWTGRLVGQRRADSIAGQAKRFSQGNILFGKLRPYLAKATYVAGPGLCSGEFLVLAPATSVIPHYLLHALRNRDMIDRIVALTAGARMPRTEWSAMGTLLLPLPPPDEQAAIVRFLDWATRRIDRAIRAKRKLVALVTEQKQAIIHRAVTRGLDPHAPMKDSGIPWLGEIPAHWEVRRVKNLAMPGYKTFVDGDWIESPYIRDSGVRLIQTGNIGTGHYREKGYRYISVDTFRAFACTEILPNDVLICRLGEPVGRACLAPDLGVRMITSVDVCILKPSDAVNAAFTVYLMTDPGYLTWVGSLVRGSTRDRISRSMLAGFLLPLPSTKEQGKIVSYLNEACGEVDTTIARTQRQIDLLREYRARLVADVVTGKLDVRAAAAALPDEAPDDGEPLAPDDDDAADDDVDATDAPDEG